MGREQNLALGAKILALALPLLIGGATYFVTCPMLGITSYIPYILLQRFDNTMTILQVEDSRC